MVVCARSSVHKLYLGLLFEDISPEGKSVILPYANNIPHRLLRLRVHDVKPLWCNVKHPLYQFFFKTYHPDIAITPRGF